MVERLANLIGGERCRYVVLALPGGDGGAAAGESATPRWSPITPGVVSYPSRDCAPTSTGVPGTSRVVDDSTHRGCSVLRSSGCGSTGTTRPRLSAGPHPQGLESPTTQEDEENVTPDRDRPPDPREQLSQIVHREQPRAALTDDHRTVHGLWGLRPGRRRGPLSIATPASTGAVAVGWKGRSRRGD